MEINSIRFAGALFNGNTSRESRDQSVQTPFMQKPRTEIFAEHLAKVESASWTPSPRELRDQALTSFEAGLIDQDTYQLLASELPLEAIDVQGRVIDLSTVTDETPFDFGEYYRSQMTIAQTTGDDSSVERLKAAVAFFEA